MIYYQLWVHDGTEIVRPTRVHCTATDEDVGRYAIWKQLDGQDYMCSVSPSWKWIFVEVEVEDL